MEDCLELSDWGSKRNGSFTAVGEIPTQKASRNGSLSFGRGVG